MDALMEGLTVTLALTDEEAVMLDETEGVTVRDGVADGATQRPGVSQQAPICCDAKDVASQAMFAITLLDTTVHVSAPDAAG